MGPKTQPKRNTEAHTWAVLEKNRKLNGSNTAAKLSVELLVRIFLLYAYSNFSESYTPNYQHVMFTIAQVCHRWRKIAFALPQLWCRVRASERCSVAYVEKLLSLSRNHPLDIAFNAGRGSAQSPSVLATVTSRMTRIRTLELKWCERNDLQRIVPQRAPLLKKISLQGGLYSSCTIEEVEACECPSLEHLSITYHALRWDSSLLRPSLTQLILRETVVPIEGQSCSLSKVLDVLATLPLLQCLELDSALPSDASPDTIPRRRQIRLPQLRTLTIDASSSSTAQLLRHTAFPTSATVSLTCHDGDVRNLQDLLATVAGKWTGKSVIGPPILFQSATLYLSDVSEYTMACNFLPHSIFKKSPFRLVIGSDLEGGGLQQDLLASIMRLFSGLKLTYLHLSAPDSAPHDADTWFTYCATMTDLRALHVEGEWANEALALALTRNLPQVSAGTTISSRTRSRRRPLFPSLKRLHLATQHYPFSGDEYGIWADEDTIPVDEYLEAITARASSGMPLDVVNITNNCNERPDCIDDLSEHVDVTWNADTDGENEEWGKLWGHGSAEEDMEGDQDEAEDDSVEDDEDRYDD